MIDPVREWAVGWLNGRDEGACERALAPDYRLRIGSVELDGRDKYMSATLGQLANYPGLVLTVHDLIRSGDFCAVAFTEHGAAVHRDGAVAAWRGIVIHRCQDRLIQRSWAEEDYASRSAQLATGQALPVLPPAAAPWDVPSAPVNAHAESRVRNWLEAGMPVHPDIVVNSGQDGADARSVPTYEKVDIDVLFSAGPAVGFHAIVQHAGGARQGAAGLLRTSEQGALTGQVVTDRAGLQRQQKADTSAA